MANGWNFRHSRALLVLFVFILLLSGAAPLWAQTLPPAAPCNLGSSPVATCNGNVSTGVLLANGGGPYTTLNVTNLTAAITPTAGVTAIEFDSNGAVTLNVDTGAFGITVVDANGVFASSNGNTVSVTSAGDIHTSGGGASGLQTGAQNNATTILSSSNITTTGNNAFGIAAGSVEGIITVTSSGTINTAGTFSAGINVGSIGTNAGDPEGAISITSTNSITTTGIDAIGINASSVFGSITIDSSGGAVEVSGAASVGINAQTEGAVNITAGAVTAGADSSVGILALSQSEEVIIHANGPVITHGATGIGVYGRAGATTSITTTGTVSTTGDNAQGVSADGFTGATVNTTQQITTSGPDADGINANSDTGNVDITAGAITTLGINSSGIDATAAGNVTIHATGNITVANNGSHGIVALSSGADIAIVTDGTVVASGNGSAVRFDGGGTNTLTNNGTLNADGGNTIRGGANNEAVVNNGTVFGNINLDAGTNSFSNQATGIYRSGTTVNLGNGNLFTNAGIFAPQGPGVAGPSAITGNFTQVAGGILDVDVDGDLATSDFLQTLGAGTGNLAGTVRVTMANPVMGAQTNTFFSAGGGTTDSGLTLLANPALHAVLSFPDANNVDLTTNINFIVTGLNGNQTHLGTNLNQILTAGGSGVSPVITALLSGTPSTAAYAARLDQLSPQIYLDSQAAALYSGLSFADALMSCKVRDGDYFTREGECMWASVGARQTDRSPDNISSHEDAYNASMGAQKAVANNWRIGIAAGYEHTALDMSSGANSLGHQGHAGVVVKYTDGPLLLAAGFSGGAGWVESERPVSFGGFTDIAKSDHMMGYWNQRLRAAYDVPLQDNWHLKPRADFNVTDVYLGDITESGAGAANLSVKGEDQVVFSFSPALEVGNEWKVALEGETLLRPFMRVGGTVFSDDSFAASAQFDNAPGGTPQFSSSSEVDQVMADVAAGLDLLTEDTSTLRVSYEGHYGATTTAHSVGLRGSHRF